MGEYSISSCAYVKMILHAAKYPHNAVNGVLLADKTSGLIVDAIPLFHICLYVSPMAEIALVQVEEMAQARSLKIVGYYCAQENLDNNKIETAPGVRVAEKIAELIPNACFVVINNQMMTKTMEQPAMNLWQHGSDGRWNDKGAVKVEQKSTTLEATGALLNRGACKELSDFDNYLDNVECDWRNPHLNRDLNQILAMY